MLSVETFLCSPVPSFVSSLPPFSELLPCPVSFSLSRGTAIHNTKMNPYNRPTWRKDNTLFAVSCLGVIIFISYMHLVPILNISFLPQV